MAEYRNKTTGEVKTQGEWRRVHKNTSLPRTWTAATLDGLNLEPVLEAPKPTDLGTYQAVRRDGVVQDAKGNWVQAWAVVDMFSDYTAEDGTLVTKAEQEAAYDEKLKAEERKTIKARRDEAISAGTTVNGVTVATDDLSQQRITGAALAATVDNTTTVKWKLPDDTFVTLDAAQIIGIAQGVRAHVQACFDREAELLAALDAGEAYDIDAGWPA